MWKLKVKVNHKDCPIVNRAQKFGVSIFSYPNTWYRKAREKRVTTICFMQGSPEAKTAFINDFEKDPKLSRLEVEGDIFVYEYRLHKGGQHVQLYYNNEMVFVEPVLNSPEGFEYWHVASWEKEVLQKFFADLLKNMDYCEMLSFAESKLKNVYFPNVMPKLPPQQLRAIMLAFQLGYYSYPRKIKLRELAQRAGSSLSAFQEKLRKAELVLIPNFIEKYLSPAETELVIKARLSSEAKRRKKSRTISG